MFENSEITISHFGTATVPKPPPPHRKNLIISEALSQSGFHLLLTGTAPSLISHFAIWPFQKFSQISGACNIWSPVLVHPSFFLRFSSTLKIFFLSLTSVPPSSLKKLKPYHLLWWFTKYKPHSRWYFTIFTQSLHLLPTVGVFADCIWKTSNVHLNTFKASCFFSRLLCIILFSWLHPITFPLSAFKQTCASPQTAFTAAISHLFLPLPSH